MKKNIRWQPELAHTIIYWSLTLIILFFSLILSLENTGPYWKSNIVLGVFLVFLFLGWRRSLILKSNSVIIRYAAFWKDREITVGQIRSLTPTNTGVQMTLQNEKAPSVFMMRKKDQVVLFDHLEKSGPKVGPSSQQQRNNTPYTKNRKS